MGLPSPNGGSPTSRKGVIRTTILLSRLNEFQRKQYKRHKSVLLTGIRLWVSKGKKAAYMPFRMRQNPTERFVLYATEMDGYLWASLWDSKRQFVAGVAFKEDK